MDEKVKYTQSGVRLQRNSKRPGKFNWLLLPGGPGLGSGYLESLAAVLTVPGSIWLVDLPGDGSNISSTHGTQDQYYNWPEVLLEAAELLPDSIFVGHSTGGMYLLSVPELEKHISGLVLISTAPDASWQRQFEKMASENPLDNMEEVAKQFEAQKTNDSLRAMTVASAPWSFTKKGLAAGRALFTGMSYNVEAMEWSDENFDHLYSAKWWPKKLPTLLLSGMDDRIIVQNIWSEARYQGNHILWRKVQEAGHYPWIEQPDAVSDAFAEFVKIL